jgi:Xaa-Pro aminopeptidase
MSEFSNRRQKLFDLLPEGSLALIRSGVSKIHSEDEYYPFSINNDFFYLTGFKQENSTLMLVKGVGEERTYLFIDEYSELKEKWTGKRATLEEASLISDIQNVLVNGTLDTKLELALEKGSLHYGSIKKVFLDTREIIHIHDEFTQLDEKERLASLYPHIEFNDVHPLITKLRMVKSHYEIECIKEAINLTNLGINKILLEMKVGKKEYELADSFEFYGREHGRSKLAFSTIVAAGKNATILHYPQQMDMIKANDLVLFDLGYAYKGYASDISRTYPVSGVFTDLQRKIYDIVLLCNKAVIEYIRPGLTIHDLQNYTIEFYTNELTRRGLLKEGEDVRKYYYHNVSHHLGLDTHDVSDRDTPLEPGNVITVEPGLYFAQYGIGIRIEDDVLVTAEGSDVLSRNIKKDVRDIEKMLG